MILLKVFDPVVNNLELFLYYGHPLGKVVVLPNFSSQLINLGVGDRLSYFKALLHVALATAVADNNARQRDEACQYAYRARYHGYGDLRVHALTSSKYCPMSCEGR